MLAAIDGAEHQILFETYIWKGDEIGERFKQALDAGPPGAGSRSTRSTTGSPTSSSRPLFKRFGPRLKVLEYPVYTAGWRFFDLRRYGRDHRKILVVDDRVGFVGGYNIGTRLRHRVARHPRADHRARGLGPQARRSPTSGTCTARTGTACRPLLLETAADWEPRIRVHRNVPRLWMFPIRSMYLEAINRASQPRLADPRLLHPRPDFVEALKEAARRGVDVRLLLPATSNHVRRRLALPGLLRRDARRRRADLPVPGRDGARQDLHDRRPLVAPSARPTSTGSR